MGVAVASLGYSTTELAMKETLRAGTLVMLESWQRSSRREAVAWYDRLFAVGVNWLWLHEELWSGRPDHRVYMALTDMVSRLKGKEQQMNQAVQEEEDIMTKHRVINCMYMPQHVDFCTTIGPYRAQLC